MKHYFLVLYGKFFELSKNNISGIWRLPAARYFRITPCITILFYGITIFKKEIYQGAI